MVVDSNEAYEQSQRRLSHLLSEVGSESAAVALAKALVAGQGQEMNVEHLRACVYTDVGVRLQSIALIEEGIRVWDELRPHQSATVSYNLASAHLHRWQLAVEQADLGEAWLNKRSHLHEARRLFNSVAQDEQAGNDLRLKALTDCGNSFDIVGRHLDALNCYDDALKLDSLFGMASGNRGITLLKVAPLMGDHESHVLLQAAADLDIAIDDRARVLRCGGQSAVDTFVRSRNSLSVSADSHDNPHEPYPMLGDSHLDWCLRNRLFLHISPDCIQAGADTLDSISFRSFKLNLADDAVLDRANELIDAFNTIKQDYIAARYLVWLATVEDSPIREQARTITKRTSFWDTLNYADWGVRPGIGIQALKITVDTLDTIAAFVHLYFGSDRARNIDFRSLPYAGRRREPAPSLTEALNRPEQNRGLIALFDLSAELEEQSKSPLRKLVQRRHAATHRFFAIHDERAPDSSQWTEHLSWPELIEESLESLRTVRGSILYLAQMIHIHEKAKEEPGLPVLPFERIDIGLTDSGAAGQAN